MNLLSRWADKYCYLTNGSVGFAGGNSYSQIIWRQNRVNGGVLISTGENEVIIGVPRRK